jgi:hypothetical protein
MQKTTIVFPECFTRDTIGNCERADKGALDIPYDVVAEITPMPDAPILDMHETIQ